MGRIKKVTFYSFCFINLAYLATTLIPLKTQEQTEIINPVSQTSVLAMNNKNSSDEANSNDDYKIYNILLLGIDGRKGDGRGRCDAIHIFSFTPAEKAMRITSIPRGTKVNIANVSTQSAYLANNCHIKGIQDTIEKIEEISGINVDAYVSLGFSQSMGILRLMNLPTTPTLQFLRNRRYAIGDYQRSHNQAVFLKDMFIAYFKQFYEMPKAVRKIAFNSLESNLDFDTADYLIEKIEENKIYLNGNNIILITKPEKNKYIKELHIDTTTKNTEEWQDKDFITYQGEITNYLNNLITAAEAYLKAGNIVQANSKLKIPFAQQLWNQIEEETVREQIHYEITRAYSASISDRALKENTIQNYINEMKYLNKTEYLEQAVRWL